LSLAPQLQTAFQAHPIRKAHATNTDREIKQGFSSSYREEEEEEEEEEEVHILIVS
jgi:hypothetical protein